MTSDSASMNRSFAHEKAEPTRAKVSVVIPHYNATATLSRALDSASSQTLQPHEIIVVDDSSRPEQREALKDLLKQYPQVRLFEQERNQGPASARNRGWDEATGEWVAFLDSDDAWHANKLELQVAAALELRPVPSVIACRTVHIGSINELPELQPSEQFSGRKLQTHHLLIRNQMSTPTVMVQRSIELRFPHGRRYSEDFELWLTMVGSGHTAVILDLPLAAIFKAPYGASGLSSHMFRMILGEYNAYIGASRAGALSTAQLLFGLTISTAKAAVRLVKHTSRYFQG